MTAPFEHIQADAVHRLQAPESLAQPLHPQERCAARMFSVGLHRTDRQYLRDVDAAERLIARFLFGLARAPAPGRDAADAVERGAKAARSQKPDAEHYRAEHNVARRP